jgi:hypothetical protein
MKHLILILSCAINETYEGDNDTFKYIHILIVVREMLDEEGSVFASGMLLHV